MRFIALESGLPGGFSFGGTLEVVAFGTMVGAPATLIFLRLRPRFATRIRWPGAFVGLCLFGGLLVFRPSAATSALEGTPDAPAVTFLVFAVVLLTWGLALEQVGRSMRR